MSARHTFSFAGGEDLTTMGACWFVSYCYYNHVDQNHLNWKQVSTAMSRASVYARTRDMHEFWLKEVLNMNSANLNKNTLNLDAMQIKKMAGRCLEVMSMKGNSL